MRDTVIVVHRDKQGALDYLVQLTFDYFQEEGGWTGICLELGTATDSDALEQTQLQLHEAVEIQLNEMERLCDIEEYLRDNCAQMVPIDPAVRPEEAGFVWPGLVRATL